MLNFYKLMGVINIQGRSLNNFKKLRLTFLKQRFNTEFKYLKDYYLVESKKNKKLKPFLEIFEN